MLGHENKKLHGQKLQNLWVVQGTYPLVHEYSEMTGNKADSG